MPDVRHLTMKRLPLTAWLLVISLTAPSPLRGATAPVPLEPLRDDDYAQGCGCEFSLRPQSDATVPSVFALDLPSGDGVVRVGGVLLRLKQTTLTEVQQRSGNHTVGDSYDEVWQAGSTRVHLRYKTTFACPDDDSACEVTLFKGRMTVEHGRAKQHFSIWGSCGC
jgi:hypothetical protein